jgi:tRNA pseudouridine32 synthase/23S rRNA pseudouridine746 synthase
MLPDELNMMGKRQQKTGGSVARGELRGVYASPTEARSRQPSSFVCLLKTQNFVVIDKPSGLPVHPGPSGGLSVEDFFPQLSRRRDGPWLAHRLDTDTSGCLVIALRRAALHAAQAEFAAGRAEKVYWAIVDGVPSANEGVIEAALAKHSTREAGWRMVVDPGGQAAVTAWRVLGRGAGKSWLELRPRTGRTHQIRAHCAHLGHPLLGDPIYGSGQGRLQLLARSIVLHLEPRLAAIAAPPTDMRSHLHEIEGQGIV